MTSDQFGRSSRGFSLNDFVTKIIEDDNGKTNPAFLRSRSDGGVDGDVLPPSNGYVT